ncbi:actin-like ATPase domain-containing protein [Laetiporus sulphureus 93-53]|uniref:Actin-like ATPase domain-containing protein n=1 Tax=Laetiporus sulphureus 93-53 TaxID=1314785 RepID=A0A165BDR0_9APHY|nr:actin-like ATPase domain-containing protein [Laetiporus sulphureus 93-53]KZT00820.1 actin-like ATPase domain-containing protein [Laetiporus sulphureus 93-53]
MPFWRLFQSITNIPSLPTSFTFEHASHQEGREAKKEKIDGIGDHAAPFAHYLENEADSEIEHNSIVYACHRIVHGVDYFDPVVINEAYTSISHNGAALPVMQICIKALPRSKSIAYFDTSFHRRRLLGSEGLRNSTEGTYSLLYVHTGNSCHSSACAIQNGCLVDTTMGLTPLTGATRSGAVDASLVFHRAGRVTHDPSAAIDVHITEAESILNTESGWHALTETADFDEVVLRMKEARAQGDGHVLDDWEDDAKWKLAFDLFTDRITVSVGAYFVRLGGEVDALVFSGGIREKSAELREEVARNAACLGFKLTDMRMITSGTGTLWTEEQLEMAKECVLENAFWQ